MTDPKGPTQDALDRHNGVLRHLGAINMTPLREDKTWPRVDSESIARTRKVAELATARRPRPTPKAAAIQAASKT